MRCIPFVQRLSEARGFLIGKLQNWQAVYPCLACLQLPFAVKLSQTQLEQFCGAHCGVVSPESADDGLYVLVDGNLDYGGHDGPV